MSPLSSGFYDEKLEQYKNMNSVHYCLNNLEQVVGVHVTGPVPVPCPKSVETAATPKNAEKKTVAGADQQ
uniref:Uncharacterized protein n=1 Tax=Globodera rostochiensis TaxID=31243 RepID=A0A914HUX0_GLORO